MARMNSDEHAEDQARAAAEVGTAVYFIREGDIDNLRRLLDAAGSDVKSITSYKGKSFGESLLHSAYLYKPHDAPNRLARLLLEKDPSLISTVYTAEKYKGENVLHFTIANANTEEAKFLVGKDRSLMLGRASGTFFQAPPLVAASSIQSSAADVTAYYGEYPLSFAASKGSKDMVTFLIESGANMRAQDSLGNTAAHLAVHHGHVEVFKLLTSRCEELLAMVNNDGLTPMAYAACKNRTRYDENGREGDHASAKVFDALWGQLKYRHWAWGVYASDIYPLELIENFDALCDDRGLLLKDKREARREQEPDVFGNMVSGIWESNPLRRLLSIKSSPPSQRVTAIVTACESENTELFSDSQIMRKLIDKKWQMYGSTRYTDKLWGCVFAYICWILYPSLLETQCFLSLWYSHAAQLPLVQSLFGAPQTTSNSEGESGSFTPWQYVSMFTFLFWFLQSLYVVLDSYHKGLGWWYGGLMGYQSQYLQRGLIKRGFLVIASYGIIFTTILAVVFSMIGPTGYATFAWLFTFASLITSVCIHLDLSSFLLAWDATGTLYVAIIHSFSKELAMLPFFLIALGSFYDVSMLISEKLENFAFIAEFFTSVFSYFSTDKPTTFDYLQSVDKVKGGNLIVLIPGIVTLLARGGTFDRKRFVGHYNLARARILLCLEGEMPASERLKEKYWIEGKILGKPALNYEWNERMALAAKNVFNPGLLRSISSDVARQVSGDFATVAPAPVPFPSSSRPQPLQQHPVSVPPPQQHPVSVPPLASAAPTPRKSNRARSRGAQ